MLITQFPGSPVSTTALSGGGNDSYIMAGGIPIFKNLAKNSVYQLAIIFELQLLDQLVKVGDLLWNTFETRVDDYYGGGSTYPSATCFKVDDITKTTMKCIGSIYGSSSTIDGGKLDGDHVWKGGTDIYFRSELDGRHYFQFSTKPQVKDHQYVNSFYTMTVGTTDVRAANNHTSTELGYTIQNYSLTSLYIIYPITFTLTLCPG